MISFAAMFAAVIPGTAGAAPAEWEVRKALESAGYKDVKVEYRHPVFYVSVGPPGKRATVMCEHPWAGLMASTPGFTVHWSVSEVVDLVRKQVQP